MILSLLLLACDPADDTDVEAPTIAFLTPDDGAVVEVGDVDFSVVVENFTLVDLAKHNEGVPEGYIGVRVDGEEVLQTGATQFTLAIGTAGDVTVEAELFYGDDEEPLDEPAVATLSLTVGG